MTEKRIQFSNIVKSQVPTYVANDFPLISEFLKQYYLSQEFKSAPIDLIQNIDQYIKLDEQANTNHTVVLSADIDEFATTINVDVAKSPEGTQKFPDTYGLLKIDDEIITYTGKTQFSFTGCIRGFVGISSYKETANSENLVFNSTESADHKASATIENLTCLFLKEFLKKTKVQLLPGLSNRSLFSGLDENKFIKQSKDFYSSKGTDESFKILFKALYGEDIKIIRPKEYLFTPSNAQNLVTSNFVVEGILGDPKKLELQTIFQDYPSKAYTPIYNVEEIKVGAGKTYYRLSFDGGYNRDVRVFGATYGDFKVSPKTHVIGNVSAGSTFIDVDSTVGFETSGNLYVKYPNGISVQSGIVSYTSKTLTQFLGCSNIEEEIVDGDSVGISSFLYVKPNPDPVAPFEDVEVRVGSILTGFSKPESAYDFKADDTFMVKSLGVRNENHKFKNWVYSNPVQYTIDKIELISTTSPKTYKLTLKADHYLKNGDKLEIKSMTGASTDDADVSDIISSRVITIKTPGTINTGGKYYIKKKINKVNSLAFPFLQKFQANVQNVYKKKYSSSLLVASNSLPSYAVQPIVTGKKEVTFSGTFTGSTFKINNHGFYTGEAVYYTPEVSTTTLSLDGGTTTSTSIKSSLFTGTTGGQGLYFVKRVDDNNIQLAKSLANLYFAKFIVLEGSPTVKNNKIEPFKNYLKFLEPQKLYRELAIPTETNSPTKTNPGSTGVLVNGVEILNYKSNDLIYHGSIEDIEVTAPGDSFDVVNPPSLKIEDVDGTASVALGTTSTVGTGATGFLAVSGSLREIRLLDRGFDYIETPTVSITGANGKNARAQASMKLIDHSVEFFSDPASARVGLGSTLSTIGFSTYHKFRVGEQVVYRTNSQQGVGGLSTDAIYYASITNPTTVKLHNSLADAVVGINTVTLSFHGVGKHNLQCVSKKSIIDSINIIDRGTGYENKKRSVSVSGINTSLDTITIKNHDYNSGEIIRYSVGTGNTIGGLIDGRDYYVTKLDIDTFKLSEIGTISQGREFYYSTNQYIDLVSKGSNNHYFNYRPISVEVKGAIGISSVGTETFNAKVQPIVRGSVTSVHLENKGVGYGNNEIINFNRRPAVSVVSGKNAQVKPIVTADGRIVEVVIENIGSNYTSTPDLVINGPGIGCVLTPIFKNGQLSEVLVIESGIGYSQETTTIDVIATETRADFNPVLKTWRFNLFEKLYQNKQIKDDDVVLSLSSSEKYGLQCYHMYAPRKLREIMFSVGEGGEILYGSPDLKIVNSEETEFTDHSPIIGWAYDGNPIYGPYGYSNVDGGIVTLMKSSYKLNSQRVNGPPTSIYPLGFFVEDYSYYENNDDSFLDRNNGRFCITPEYPNGTYAYFATLNPGNTESAGSFQGYKLPQFPYLIGDKYQSKVQQFNFENSSNQDEYDINNTDWCRNTFPYNLTDDVEYPYIYTPNELKQTGKIISTRRGTVEGIEIKSAGESYKVGDLVNFSDAGTTGFGAAGKVSLLKGRQVTSIVSNENIKSNSTIIPSPEKGNYIVESSTPHGFDDLDIVNLSGLSTTSSKIEGSYKIGVSSESFRVVGTGTTGVAVGTTSVTGLVTFFEVRGGDLTGSSIVPNDILGIGTERVKVLNIDPLNSRLRVLRAVDGTIGGTHAIGSTITEISRRFTINSGFKTTYDFKRNKEIYFSPIESIGLGTGSGVGIGTTITFSYPGAGATQVFIPTKSIFIKNHNLNTGDSLTYSTNGGQGIVYNEYTSIGAAKTLSEGQTLFVAKISNDLIGVATQRVGLGTTGEFVGIGNTSKTLFFTGVGAGTTHSFTTNYSNIIGDVTKRVVTVTTKENHGVTVGHVVYVDVNPSVASTHVVKYNQSNRRILVGINTFASSGINTTTNTFTITDHGYSSGDKVIHSSTTPSGGLENDKIYYVSKVDVNNFKLSNTHYESVALKPTTISITSASSGEFGLINPPISAYRSSTVVFDLTDSTLSYTKQSTNYSAFKLNFYTDSSYTSKWESDGSDRTFNVIRQGTPGISTDAKVTVSIGNTTPETLFYRLDPITDNDLSTDQIEVSIDTEVVGYNQLQSRTSIFSGNRTVAIARTNSFDYHLTEVPERNSYVSTSSSITYTTDCTHTDGPIAKVDVTSSGKNYDILPEITSIDSIDGVKADLFAVSSNVGNIEKVKLNDIGYDFPTDNTLKPSAILPQIIKVDAFAKVGIIGINSAGRGYSSAPKLLAFDGKTGSLINDLDIGYNLGDTEVTIFSNTDGINNSVPTILPTRNSNGVGISTVGFNTVTKDVVVTLSVGFSTASDFPFAVNDKVMVENVSVGVGSTGKGFNSKDYGYKLFTLKSVTPNIGGIGSVTYNLTNDLNYGEVPGIYDDINSSGMIVPEKFFPVFEPILEVGNYLPGEKVTSNGKEGTVQSWDRGTKTLRVLSTDDFKVNDKLRGLTSELAGIASTITNYECYFEVGPSTEIFDGIQSYSGVLNSDLQRLQDSFYYQNFAYSLKSKIPFDTWNDVVSSTNHTIGYKKFADLQVESTNNQALVVGLSTETTDLSIVQDLDGFVDTNCVFDYDIARENNLNFDLESGVLSDKIIFGNRILSDFTESLGNRVLSIDDISPQFNSNPRSTAFTVVNTFPLADFRTRKYITYVRDSRFTQERQLMIVDLIHDDSFAYINQYARVESVYDQGSFDFAIAGNEGQLQFYPTKSSVNDYDITAISYNLNDNFLSTGSTVVGGSVVDSGSVVVNSGISTTIVSIGDTYHSAKVLVTIAPDVANVSYGATSTFNVNEFEAQELNIVHDGTNVSILEFGKLTTNLGGYPATGFGTYTAYLSGGQLKLDFNPAGIGATAVVNTIVVGLSSMSSGTTFADMKHARLESKTTGIASSSSPVENVIGSYPSHISASTDRYDAAHFLVQVHDTTNNRYEFLEYVVVDDHVESVATYNTYDTEYGNVETHIGLGTFGSRINVVGTAATTELLYTPISGIDTKVHVFMNALRLEDDTKDIISLVNGSIETGFAEYTGTDRDIKRSFALTHKNDPIFERNFLGNDSSIVNINANTIKLPNHFFVTGEELRYVHAGIGSTQAISITSTTFPSSGVTTTKLPERGFFAVKVNDNEIQLASSPQNSLLPTPQVIDISSVGIGTSHRFVSVNQNPKVLVALDNLIQSPIVSTSVTTTLLDEALSTDDIIKFTGITSFFGGDLVKIGNEIMLIEGVGIGSTNHMRVRRSWMGTSLSGIATGALVTKVVGNYNIVDNTLNFVEAPYGNTPLGTSTNPPDQRDYQGISTSSTFQGRSFLRSAAQNTSNETYYKNYVFDDISQNFTGIANTFTLTNQGTNVAGISNEGAIILINDIFQTSGLNDNYELEESVGVTSITFVGTGRTTQSAFLESMGRDVGVSSFPRGGMIVSVGSSEGFGYQPLVAAGGTATVSAGGTISAISIGNSGSGYRVGIQTVVNVSVGTTSVVGSNLVAIGTASIVNGNITGVTITNPGSGYTTSNPPFVVFDSPRSYSSIPLQYSSFSSGIGTGASIDIVVGQGSSIIDFNLTNTGYGYGDGEILTIPTENLTGIPTTSSFGSTEFQIQIEKVIRDEFTGWSVGVLETLDNVNSFIDGTRTDFPLVRAGQNIAIMKSKGSKIELDHLLLIFVNNILQKPKVSYEFEGGSLVTFKEAPKVGDDIKIVFYKGSGDNLDVIDREVIETIKYGDEVTLNYDQDRGQKSYLQENARTISTVTSIDSAKTLPYYGPGNTRDTNLERPITWCRQTQDKIINGQEVGKDREIYEPVITPSANIIKSVGIGSTVIYVDRLRPLFNLESESQDASFRNAVQKQITFISSKVTVAAAATAVVSAAGTISSAVISTGGVGYSTTPEVSIGIGSTRATATAIVSGGVVTGVAISNPGAGYTTSTPPSVLIAPPTQETETCKVFSYSGDSGVVVGFGTTSIGSINELILEFHIPYDSVLRNTDLVGSATTLSGISTGDYFTIFNSNVSIGATGSPLTSFDTSNNIIGITTSYIDSVFQVKSVQIVSRSIGGISTNVVRINSGVTGVSTIGFSSTTEFFDSTNFTFDDSGILTFAGGISTSNYFAEFSWGKLILDARDKQLSHEARTLNGFSGLSTSDSISRTRYLRFKNNTHSI